MTNERPLRGIRTVLKGCATLVGIFMLVLVVVGFVLKRNAQATIDAAEHFLDTALAGDDAGAWGQLLAEQREQTPAELFAEQWRAVRQMAGNGANRTMTDPPVPDFASGLVTFSYRLEGSAGAVNCELDVNPAEKPPTVVNYRLTGLSAGGAGEAPDGLSIEIVPPEAAADAAAAATPDAGAAPDAPSPAAESTTDAAAPATGTDG